MNQPEFTQTTTPDLRWWVLLLLVLASCLFGMVGVLLLFRVVPLQIHGFLPVPPMLVSDELGPPDNPRLKPFALAAVMARTTTTQPAQLILKTLRDETSRILAAERGDSSWLDGPIADGARLFRDQGVDPALALRWARQMIAEPYAAKLSRISRDLQATAALWRKSGRIDDAKTAYTAVIAMLSEQAEVENESAVLLTAAEELPHAYGSLADLVGDEELSRKLRLQADLWDRLYQDWRIAASGPANMLPNIGSRVFCPAEHRTALMALSQAGIVFAGGMACAAFVVMLGGIGLIAKLIRRAATIVVKRPVAYAPGSDGGVSDQSSERSPRRISPQRIAPPRADSPDLADERGGIRLLSAAMLMCVPTISACVLLEWLAGENWAWLLSLRLVLAVASLVILTNGLCVWLIANLGFTCEGDTIGSRRQFKVRAFVLAVLLASAVVLIADLYPVLKRVDADYAKVKCYIMLAQGWYVWCIVFFVISAFWRLIRRDGGHGYLFGRRRRAALIVSCIGLFLHSVAIPAMLWRNHRGFTRHSGMVAAAMADEATRRLGPSWRDAYTHPYRQLLSDLSH